MAKATVSVNQRYGRFTIISQAPSKHWIRHWFCECDCGNIKTVQEASLRTGHSKSCGCLTKEQLSKHPLHTTHGASKTTEYRIWAGMLNRCYNQNNQAFNRYGGRGISVCPEWRRSFQSFLGYIGHRPPRHTLERLDNEGNYQPGNVVWANYKRQARNRRNTIFVEHEGSTKTLGEISDKTGIDYHVLRHRLKAGKELTP